MLAVVSQETALCVERISWVQPFVRTCADQSEPEENYSFPPFVEYSGSAVETTSHDVWGESAVASYSHAYNLLFFYSMWLKLIDHRRQYLNDTFPIKLRKNFVFKDGLIFFFLVSASRSKKRGNKQRWSVTRLNLATCCTFMNVGDQLVLRLHGAQRCSSPCTIK